MSDPVQGRFGWYPCDYDTYLKLKQIKKRYWEAVYANARHHRWARKFPHNRIGAEPPKACPFVGKRVWTFRREAGQIFWGWNPNKDDKQLLEWCELARYPKETAAEVRPFIKSQFDAINELHRKIEEWYVTPEKVA